MKNKLILLFLIFLGRLFSQSLESTQINELNQLLVEEKKSYDLKLESLNNDFNNIRKRIDYFELKSKNLNIVPEKYEVNSVNLKKTYL
jgi:hypothetical protein